jgi:DNA-binding MltR family transcriptional regulator
MTKPKAKTLEEVRGKYERLFDALNHNSDLVCGIVATSYINDALGALLHGFFIESTTADALLIPDRGVLGSIRAKSEIAYCVGLISSPFLTNLIIVSEIRNKFAHSFEEITFQEPEIVGLCDKLVCPGRVVSATTDPDPDTEKFKQRMDAIMYGTPRRKFVTTSITLCSFLVMQAMSTEHRAKVSDIFGY